MGGLFTICWVTPMTKSHSVYFIRKGKNNFRNFKIKKAFDAYFKLSCTQEVLEKIGCSAIFISFSDVLFANKWKEDVKDAFPIYLDSDRSLYKYFKMQRSITQVSSYVKYQPSSTKWTKAQKKPLRYNLLIFNHIFLSSDLGREKKKILRECNAL